MKKKHDDEKEDDDEEEDDVEFRHTRSVVASRDPFHACSSAMRDLSVSSWRFLRPAPVMIDSSRPARRSSRCRSTVVSSPSPPSTGASRRPRCSLRAASRRHLRALGFATVTEMGLRSGRRADVVALGADGIDRHRRDQVLGGRLPRRPEMARLPRALRQAIFRDQSPTCLRRSFPRTPASSSPTPTAPPSSARCPRTACRRRRGAW